MTKHDQDTEMFQQHVLQLCRHMSGVYLKIVFDQVELALVSSHRAENIVAVNILHGLRALPAGSALKVLKDVRELLLPPIIGNSITITGIRTLGKAPLQGAAAWNAWVKRTQDAAGFREFRNLERAVASVGGAV